MFRYLLILNFWIILLIGGIITRCLVGYASDGNALDFLKRVSALTASPYLILVILGMLYFSFVLLMQIREESNLMFIGRTLLEIICALLVIYMLNFSYSGIMLLVLADVARRLTRGRWKLAAFGVIGGVYLLCDYYLIPELLKTFSLEECLYYYRGDVRTFLLGIRNVLVALNLMYFVGYILLLFREQIDETERMNELNGRLNEANEQLNEANEQLKDANLQLAAYAAESVKNAETRERNRLAREIHDTLGHTLTGIIAGIDACTMLIDAAPEAVKGQLADIADVARHGMTDVRRSVKALRPDALEKLELSRALDEMIDEMRRTTGTVIDYTCTAPLQGFNQDEEEIIYRILQESMTNAVRHGHAGHITITIGREFQKLTIRVKDDGVGCKEIHKGFGLHHMEERLSMLQGSLACSGEDGFLVTAEIPIRWGEEKE